MGTALFRIKLMPESPDSNLEEVQSKAEAIIQEEKGEKISFEKEPIAFVIENESLQQMYKTQFELLWKKDKL